jgi:hypothetical protein
VVVFQDGEGKGTSDIGLRFEISGSGEMGEEALT